MSFFFSSRRRHTRCYRDWSSDVCSSDLTFGYTSPHHKQFVTAPERSGLYYFHARTQSGRFFAFRSEERRVGKSVDLGGRRISKKKRKKTTERSPSTGVRGGREQIG